MLDSKQQITRIAVTTGVLCVIAPVGGAYALGFGDLRLRSALNQPLDAQIALTSLSAGERDSLSIRIASPDMFQRFGIERTPLVDDLRIDTRGSGPGQMILHLTSRQPVREPFLNVLVEAETSNGRALREYTLLLDPPGHPVTNSIAATRGAARPTAASSSPSGAAARTFSRQRPVAAANAVRSGVYGPVRQGETLSEIAAGLRPAGTSINQMQVALFNTNPQAFDDSMNVLHRGATLTVPEAATVAAINPATANARVAAQIRKDIAQATQDSRAAQASSPLGEAPSSDALQSPAGSADSFATQVAARSDNGLFVAPGSAQFGRLTVPDAAYWAPKPQIGVLVDDSGAIAVAPAADTGTLVDAGTGDASSSQSAPQASPGTERGALPDSGVTQAGSAASADISNQTATDPTGSESLRGAAGTPQTLADANTSEPDTTETAPAQGGGEQTASTSTTGNSASPVAAVEVAQNLPLTQTQDVASVDDSGWLSPRNILLFAGLGALGLALLAWRRKSQYKRVPLDALGESEHAQAPETVEDTDVAVVAAAPEVSEVPEPATPAQHIHVAEQQIEAGEFLQARATLEQGLAEDAHAPALQDKLLELDYLLGDASHFDQDLQRFDDDLRRNGERHARIAAMGRVLLPGDSRFVFGRQVAAQAQTAATVSRQAYADEAVPAATTSEALEQRHAASGSSRSAGVTQSGSSSGRRWSDRPIQGTNGDAANELLGAEISDDSAPGAEDADKNQTTDLSELSEHDAPTTDSEDSDDDSLRLDTAKTDLSGYDWQASEIDTSGERQHDKSDEPGLAFDPDAVTASDKESPAPIDANEFDLDDGSDASADDADEDPVAVQLDLAAMYVEMEDDSSARPLLEEVLETGDESQREDAQALLAKLG